MSQGLAHHRWMEAEIPTTPEPTGSQGQQQADEPELGRTPKAERPTAARRHARRLLHTATDELTRITVKAGLGGVAVGIAYVIHHWR
ncbi:hypothetical protein [Streptomyces sp. NPDC049813]|uniref:hypothetical protein n=1 Tax=Streptomyces sp. NPDC049813 TaxID=3365597 RepID=UPI00379548E6